MSKKHSKSLSKVKLNLKFVTSAENLLVPMSMRPIYKNGNKNNKNIKNTKNSKNSRNHNKTYCDHAESKMVSNEFSTRNIEKSRNTRDEQGDASPLQLDSKLQNILLVSH